MLSRAELVALTVAILAAAAGAIGGEVVGFILLGAAVLLGIAIVSGLGERFGLVARPKVRFLDAEVSGIRGLPSPWNGSGVFVSIPVVNERGPDVALFVELSFTTLDGEPLFDGRSFRARWSNTDAPPLMPIGRALTMRELRSEEIPEAFDVLTVPNETPRLGSYVFNNDSWHRGRADEFRIEADEFHVTAVVQGKGVREQATWKVVATTFPLVDRVDEDEG